MKNNKHKITKLKTEIKIKDLLIKELMVLITENNVKVPETLLKNIRILFAGAE